MAFINGWMELLTLPRWWQLKYFWNFHPEIWGNDPNLTSIFSSGLVQPPTRIFFEGVYHEKATVGKIFKMIFLIFWYSKWDLSQETHEKRAPGCLGYSWGDDKLPQLCGDYSINNDKDPCATTSIMESKRVFSWLTYRGEKNSRANPLIFGHLQGPLFFPDMTCGEPVRF